MMYEKPWNTGFVANKERAVRACGERPPKGGKNSHGMDKLARIKCLGDVENYPPVHIGAYHSYCGTDWQEVATGKGKSRVTLDLKRPMCCKKDKTPVCEGGIIT